jgi:tetratricopeptide (TPR) repeat protein
MEVGRHEEVGPLFEEATEIYRQLATSEPSRYAEKFAGSTNNLGIWLARQGGQPDIAVGHFRQIIGMYSYFARLYPDRFLSELAMAQVNLGFALRSAGCTPEAVQPSTAGVDIYRQLERVNPESYRPRLAMALGGQAVALAASGHGMESISAVREAVDIMRELSDQDPVAYLPAFAELLMGFVQICLQSDRDLPDALIAARHAAEICEPLTFRMPQRFVRDFISAHRMIEAVLDRMGEPEKAAAARDHLIAIVRSAQGGPEHT